MNEPTSRITTHLSQFFGKEYNLLILAAGIGVLAGAASTVFRWMILFFQNVFSENGLLMGLSAGLAAFLLPFMPMLGGLVIGFARRYFPDAVAENGVDRVIEAVVLKNGHIRKRVLAVCALTSSITIGSGGSAGRVGPTVQICSVLGSVFGQMLKLSRDRVRVLVGCGAAAGIAATFNAPLAGMIFVMEIILGEFTIHSLSPIVIASVMGTVTGRAIEGNQLTFLTPVHEVVNPSEIFFYLILGILCGLTAHLFIQSYFRSQKFFEEKVKISKILKPALGGLIVGLIALITPQVRGNGFPEMEQVLNGNLFWGVALLLIATKIIATAVTLGSGGVGGTFAPSLFIGSMVGATFGAAIHALLPEWTASSETYALVGMGALASAALQAPLTSILILFEMTQDYTIVLPSMVCCIVATYTMRRFTKHSIYIQSLLNRGINIQHGKAISILSSMFVRDVMTREVVTLDEEMPFKSVLETVSYSRHLYYPVVDQEARMTGIISFSDIKNAAQKEGTEKMTAAEMATREVTVLRPSHNLNEALEKFSELDIEQIPVVEVGDSRKVIGLIRRSDVQAVYNREVLITTL
ncbi:MAG: CBS domain-containing protein [Nitrospinaceae bacterium]|nr:chloride channel protein [Nitrospinaceae bacterium]NIR57342.1 chloride channel protein [Nitrospinaceae bacterium]NIS87794.1 chloride channel protein [Nitrospinaceae bacterium]NIT84664.1 chloride channel protein [Nitrospinaceae bacterium]NIU46843.1 chloride channel protein [Nitrospinaceae bacterium]